MSLHPKQPDHCPCDPSGCAKRRARPQGAADPATAAGRAADEAAVRLTAQITGGARNRLYDLALAMKSAGEDSEDDAE